MSVIDTTNPSSQAKTGQQFTLFDSKQDSEQSFKWVNLTIKQANNLSVGAPVRYRGYLVGEVAELKLLTDLSGVQAGVKLHSQYANHFLREDSLYWLVQPQLNLAGVKNLSAAILGDSLAVAKGQGAFVDSFTVSAKNIAQIDGLKIQLRGDKLGSINQGNPLLYKQLRIGEVVAVGLMDDITEVSVDVVVYDEYKHLIVAQSQFYNVSGIKVDAGLFSGVNIQTQTLETMMTGGIALATVAQGSAVDDGHVFTLHRQAQPQWIDGVINTMP